MNFAQAIASCMGQYATFSGRASRGEFWWFYLFTILLSWGASIVGEVTIGIGMGVVMSNIVALALMLPALAAGCRRLHDIGKSGWWQLLILTGVGVVILIFWWAQPPRQEGDEYAPSNADPGPA